jgi:hypothetical protein
MSQKTMLTTLRSSRRVAASARRVPHSEQNFAPGALSVPQFGQVTR